MWRPFQANYTYSTSSEILENCTAVLVQTKEVRNKVELVDLKNLEAQSLGTRQLLGIVIVYTP